jgi:hypothetical protein
VNALNCRNWILSPLNLAGIALVFLVGLAQAATLKDIRVGEYEQFTRIVFELDALTEPKLIRPTDSGQLTIVFDGTVAKLIRKIPFERSQQVKDFQIWHINNTLSAVVFFKINRFRYESFSLIDPPRMVLDIHPLPKDTAPAASDKSGKQDSSKDLIAESKEPAPLDTGTNTKPTVAAEMTLPLRNEEPSLSPSLTASANTNNLEAATANETSDVNLTSNPLINDSPAKASGGSSQPIPFDSNPLQFYLVIALVLITIVILVLLLIMLLSRHQWIGGKPQLEAKKFLQNQDKHIASIDARIQEQLKRYEEV